MLFRSFVEYHAGNLAHLLATGAPWSAYRTYLTGSQRRKQQRQRFEREVAEFRAYARQKRFSNDWFTQHIPRWLSVFEAQGLKDRALDMLEIGSWEGMSSLFLLKTFPQATLTCVDTWEGADEQKSSDLSRLEQTFDGNVAEFAGRVTKFRGTSHAYFESGPGLFDLIYIDGSHRSDDVLVDALKGFALLRRGGIMIFDDYLWHLYRDAMDNPAGGINAFLRLKRGRYALLCADEQLIIEKTSD